MALPTKEKTWIIDACNPLTMQTINSVIADAILSMKTSLRTMSGVTVKGSCNGTTGAMDAVDRWSTTANTSTRTTSLVAAQSWIVLDLANMGGTELLITNLGTTTGSFALYFSPGGNYVVAATATHKPTATDEVTLSYNSALLDGATGTRHLWTSWLASDGSAFFFALASRLNWASLVCLQLVTPLTTVGTFNPAVVGAAFTGATNLPFSTTRGVTRVDPGTGAVNIAGFLGVEGAETGIAATLYPVRLELQGNEYGIYPLTFWSETATARGAVGRLVDIWAAKSNANNGSTYGSTRQFITYYDLMLPWDGSIAVFN